MTSAPNGLDAWLTSVGGVLAPDATTPTVVDVPTERWVESVTSARDDLALTWFDALTTVDEGDGSFSVLVHLVGRGTPAVALMLRTRVVAATQILPSLRGVYAGAAWHERESVEMFGITVGDGNQQRLLLAPGFEGAPLRKEFVLAPRAARSWPGAKDPGESDSDVAPPVGGQGGTARSRRRRRAVPPGVPSRDDEGQW